MSITMRCWLGLVVICAMTVGTATKGATSDPSQAVASSTTTSAITNEYCPVMTKTKALADLWLDYEGQRIYFCHEVCKTRFRRAPEKYLVNLPVVMQHAIREHQQAAATAGQVPAPATAESPASGPAGPGAEERGADVDTRHGTFSLRRVGQYLGRFHPVVVHLPIGLLLGAGLAEVLFMWARAQWLAGAARFSVLLGAAAAIVAASSGWLIAMSVGFDGEQAQVLEYHRWLGTGTAALAIIAVILFEVRYRRPSWVWPVGYRIALLLAAVAVALTGHFGGTLVYGVGFLKW